MASSCNGQYKYKFRPNKSVDRELFILFLSRTIGLLHTDAYQYIGLGGSFLEDFRLIHSKIGIKTMVCLDYDESIVARQQFNKPIPSIICECDTIENYVRCHEFDHPVVIWFDFTTPDEIIGQIESFVEAVASLPVKSILRITLNANPISLGIPAKDQILKGEKELDWRLRRFRERFGDYAPQLLKPSSVSREKYGHLILKTLNLALEKRRIEMPDRDPIWGLSVHYSDGQPMVTSTLVIAPPESANIQTLLRSWEFYSTPDNPLTLDIPALTIKERVALETAEDMEHALPHKLPMSSFGVSPIEEFRKFYRLYPNFAKVDY